MKESGPKSTVRNPELDESSPVANADENLKNLDHSHNSSSANSKQSKEVNTGNLRRTKRER